MTATPKMPVIIKRDRFGLFATVTLIHDGKEAALTTMAPDVEQDHVGVQNLQRQLMHIKKIRAD